MGAEIDDLPKFKVRDDDIWVCSWPRSGKGPPSRECLRKNSTPSLHLIYRKNEKGGESGDRFIRLDQPSVEENKHLYE